MTLTALTLAGLGLRLLVWRWREFYPLGGDETEYFNQALTWLQGKGYVDLPLMRPPLYTVFLAVVFRLFDSQVQRVRFVQALISTATIPLMWLWAREVFRDHPRRSRIALVTAAITALCYTFAANATELLTETLFVAGLTLVFWLIVRAARVPNWRWAIAAGIGVGLLSLLRSVALPLVPLGAVWLLTQNREPSTGALWANRERAPSGQTENQWLRFRRASPSSWFLILGALLVITPWTIRNYVRYATPLIIDTTGAENLWLDNDPATRDVVKRQLYALGDDRGARQRLAMQRGITVIAADPARFAAKAWGEAKKFVALEYWDDLRTRRAIWVPPLEVWLRLLLGDGVWLLVLLGGIVGVWLARDAETRRGGNRETGRQGDEKDRSANHQLLTLGVKWLLVPWALYVLLTGLIFHVELRYRLPLYPALLPYAAWLVAGGWRSANWPAWKVGGAALTVAGALALLLLHRPYLAEATMLTRKQYHLWRSDPATASTQPIVVQQHAAAALALDPESALARVRLGLVANRSDAERWWRDAIRVLPAQPYAHLLLGNSLRAAGNLAGAKRELAFEDKSLEDLQAWTLRTFNRQAENRIDIGDGLDLGAITGFYPAVDGARWTRRVATIQRLSPGSRLSLRLRSPRPVGAVPATVIVRVNDTWISEVQVGADWQTATFDLPATLRASSTPLVVTLESTTFRPRAYDRASPDNRELGVEVDWVQSQ